MKNKLLIPVILASVALPLQAEILQFDFSPSGTSPAVGLSPANEVPAASGTGSGGEILGGITFDTTTKLLSLPIAYGSFGGFTNLTGPATAAHIHGPASTTATAPPIHDFLSAGQHLAAPVPAEGGVIVGSVTLNAANEASLLGGLLYVNIHTAANANGEIRGQLVQSTGSPTVTCPEETTVECSSHEDTPVELVARVGDPDGDSLIVVWTIDGEAQPEIEVPSGGATTSAEVPFEVDLGLGEHTVSVSVSDGTNVAVSCETTVTVEDTVAPEIIRIKADPETLWPPNGKMRKVNLDVKAKDACGDVTTEIVSVVLSDGGTADFVIVDEDTVQLRAKRAGNSERTYTITVEATDESGNSTTGTVDVTVPKSQGKKGNQGHQGNQNQR
ncbi:CHRD domain-containing protein [Luteolibacter luteus]|uniref:CHRD domain-containing protein n=1 Tax=Luteolibacter luteus TaxID=2728835 RepID=A0A858RGM0_9BACT|nr:CHRD domain-containing protein [Luteolibacter luteus]QJE95997.1 CHRD domain-containing protein [Luteolibacter luteus]